MKDQRLTEALDLLQESIEAFGEATPPDGSAKERTMLLTIARISSLVCTLRASQRLIDALNRVAGKDGDPS